MKVGVVRPCERVERTWIEFREVTLEQRVPPARPICGRQNPDIRGIKTAPFGVLVRTEMPAILAEVSCLSNREEADLLLQPSYREYIAAALLEGIIDYSEGLKETYQREG